LVGRQTTLFKPPAPLWVGWQRELSHAALNVIVMVAVNDADDNAGDVARSTLTSLVAIARMRAKQRSRNSVDRNEYVFRQRAASRRRV
jgi:hypothetical protein